MPIPDYETLMLPVLRLAADGAEHNVRDAIEVLSDEFSLTQEERNEMLPSGNQLLFNNRFSWARTYLKQAGLLTSPKRGIFIITARGKELLAQSPDHIDTALLDQYPEFLEFRSRRKDKKDNGNGRKPRIITTVTKEMETPEDALAAAYTKLRQSLEAELLDTIKEASPAFFERLVVDLLVNMGYGGNRRDAGKALGKSGDGGIDGIIKEDRLGLDVIYIQAKRWEGTVGRPEIQKFAGALQGQRARKGVFITTSSFSREAEEYSSIIDTRIILIDGERLTSLMVDHNVGVSTVGQYEVKKIDSDYFDNE